VKSVKLQFCSYHLVITKIFLRLDSQEDHNG